MRKIPVNKILFSVIGAGSLVWFLLRVIPKPSRATYPCMRLAAPMASTFVIWLLGLGASFLFFRRARALFRRSRKFAAAACLLAGALAGGILLSTPHSRAFAGGTANRPIGQAKGACPGRVVWIHDSTVSNWKGLGDGHLWEDRHVHQAKADAMVSRMLQSLAGKKDAAAAWDTLFRYSNGMRGRGSAGYKAGEKIAIKINLTSCNAFPAYCCADSLTYALNKKLDYMNPVPQVVRALLRQLVNVVGVRQSNISIGDPTAYYPNELYDSCHAEFPDIRFMDHAGRNGRVKVEFSDVPVFWSCRPTAARRDFVSREFAEATYIVNLANMKSHLGGGLTLCAKNHYGSFIRLPTDSGYYDLHQSLAFKSPDAGKYRALVDIMGHAHLGGKTVLYLIDGIYEGNHNRDTVPDRWAAAPFNGGWTSSLFASQDPVAIESVLFDIYQSDQDSYQYHSIAGAQDYLVEAAQADNPPSGTFYDPDHETPTVRLKSLGVYEHWNNATDRKYSRNLGTGEGIELVFLEGAASGVRMNPVPLQKAQSLALRGLSNSSKIQFTIPRGGMVTLTLSDATGRSIPSGINGYLGTGTYRTDLHDVLGGTGRLAAGYYIAKLTVKGAGAAAPASVSGRISMAR